MIFFFNTVHNQWVKYTHSMDKHTHKEYHINSILNMSRREIREMVLKNK